MRKLLLFIHLHLLFIPNTSTYQLLPSSSSSNFTESFTLKGRTSTIAVDVYGLDNPASPAILVTQAAFNLVSNVWTSQVLVKARISFIQLDRPDALASGGGVLFVRFDNSPDRELLPVAAAEAITGHNLNLRVPELDQYDILIKVNTQVPWNVDLSRAPSASEYDLFTVIIHETYHNLLFSGAINLDGKSPYHEGMLLDGYPARFDLFLANEDGCAVLDYLVDQKLAKLTGKSPAQLLAQAVTNERLYFFDIESQTNVPLYAPFLYNDKSSIYHIDVERGGTAGVMSRFIPMGFMDREINDEMKKMQTALLDPKNRGARHCSFPLSDPSPLYTANASHLPTEPILTGQTSVFRAPMWGILMVATLFVSIIVFFCFSHYMMKKRQRSIVPQQRKGNIGTEVGRFRDRQFSNASSEFLIDGGISYDDVEIDVRDIEIDEDDFKIFEYSTRRRYTNSSYDRNQ